RGARKDVVSTPQASGPSGGAPSGRPRGSEVAVTTLTTREVFQAGTDAFNAHDIDAFAELLADDVVFDAPGMPRDSGRAACAAFYRGWIEAFPDARVEVDAVHEPGDGVVIEEGRFVGTHAGPLPTPPRPNLSTRRRAQ